MLLGVFINDIIKCLYVVLLVGGLTGISILLKKKRQRVLLLILLFCISWRFFLGVDSHRAYTILIIASILLSYIAVETFLKQRKFVKTIIVLLCITIQLHKTFHGYRNTFIYDIKDHIHKIQNKYKYGTFLINYREYQRIREDNGDFIYLMTNKTDTNNELTLGTIAAWKSPFWYIAKDNEGINDYNRTDKEQLIKIACFPSNKSHRNTLSINQKIFYSKDDIINQIDSNNCFKNGDMEDLILQPDIKKKYSKAIQLGNDYLNDEKLVLPKHAILLSGVRGVDDCPIVYTESRYPLNGKSSLHCSFPENPYSKLYLLESITSKAGYLFLTIKVKKQTAPIIIQKFDYDENVKLIRKSQAKYMVWFKDDLPHNIVISFKNDDFLGKTSLFLLQSSNSEVILDNLQYFYTKPLTN